MKTSCAYITCDKPAESGDYCLDHAVAIETIYGSAALETGDIGRVTTDADVDAQYALDLAAEALQEAERIVAGKAKVCLHKGSGTHRAIRIYHCWPEDALELGREIELALGIVDGFRQDAGFAAVWLR